MCKRRPSGCPLFRSRSSHPILCSFVPRRSPPRVPGHSFSLGLHSALRRPLRQQQQKTQQKQQQQKQQQQRPPTARPRTRLLQQHRQPSTKRCRAAWQRPWLVDSLRCGRRMVRPRTRCRWTSTAPASVLKLGACLQGPCRDAPRFPRHSGRRASSNSSTKKKMQRLLPGACCSQARAGTSFSWPLWGSGELPLAFGCPYLGRRSDHVWRSP
mmetsp:Transcript_85051/g.177747  ORF Transcript_85051/g.177747 Transcript_85051/m.177747 type:complete len:212 (-) Transcript_85051:513-1148(-)